jgi:putative spermidine/putrescine transport system permease protein
MTYKIRMRLVLFSLLAPGLGYLLVFFGFPLLRVVVASLAPQAGWLPDLTNYATVLGTPIYREGLLFSLWLALAPTVLAVLVGVPLAALLVRTFPGKNFFGSLYKIPLVVPSIVAAFIVLILVDRGGLAHRWAALVGVGLPRMVRDPGGIGIIMAAGWKNIPFMALIVAGSMAAIPEDLLRAARTLGAGTATIFLRIQLPLALPGITAASLLVFITSLGAFAIPNLLGPPYPLPLSVHMYNQGYERGNWPLVYAMGTMLSVAAILVLLAYYGLTRKAQRALREGRS